MTSVGSNVCSIGDRKAGKRKATVVDAGSVDIDASMRDCAAGCPFVERIEAVATIRNRPSPCVLIVDGVGNNAVHRMKATVNVASKGSKPEVIALIVDGVGSTTAVHMMEATVNIANMGSRLDVIALIIDSIGS